MPAAQAVAARLTRASCSVKRLRDKHEAELAELEQAERRLQDQCAELKGRLAEAEGEGARLQGLVRQKDKALAEVKAVSSGRVGGLALSASTGSVCLVSVQGAGSRRSCRPRHPGE